MRNIDRFRAMSLEEIAPYLIGEVCFCSEILYHSPSGYMFENYDAAIANCIHWLDKEYDKNK